MSYILDALNKSEQERQKGRVPDLKTVHTRPKRTSLPWTGILLLVVIVGIAGYGWLWLNGSLSAPQTPVQTAAQDSDPAGDETPVSPAPASKPEQTQPVVSKVPVINEVSFEELPLSIRQQLPDLVFSSHIYADEPDFRMVSINGASYREGERLNDALRIITITEEGVVLRLQNYQFEMSVLRDWHSR